MYVELPKTLKSDYITNKHEVASFDNFYKRTSYYYGNNSFWSLNPLAFLMDRTI